MYTTDAITAVTETVKTEHTYRLPQPGDNLDTCNDKLWAMNREVTLCEAHSDLTTKTGDDLIRRLNDL